MLAARPALLRSLVALIVLVAFAGCSKKDKSEIAVATVNDTVISLEYFERKMNTIPPQELPADIAGQAGREELLETMIKKEVMVLKAVELGIDEDGTVDEQAQKIAGLTAVSKMRNEVASVAQEPVTESEIQTYYEMLPRKLMVSYMVFNFEKQANEARALVEGGENWQKVARQFNAGAPGRNDDFTMPILYGTVADDFEREVFSLPVGAISEPIESPYGFFVVRIDDITFERVQPLDTMRDKVIESIRSQKEALSLHDFINEVFAEYNLFIDDDIVQVVYDGIPEDLPLEPPYPNQEDLESLRIDSEYLDEVMFSFHDEVWTVRRYADFFENSSIFGRPRREGQPAGLRRSLKEIAIRELMDTVAADRGYGALPEVQDEYRTRREQMMVTRLNEQLVRDQIDIGPEELQAWWEERQEEFRRPEMREVHAIICETEADCISAEIDLAGGATWEEIVERYCIPSDVRDQNGDIGKMASTHESPLKPIAFTITEEGEVSEPTELSDGKWAMVRVDLITPTHIPELKSIRTQVGARMRGEREDELFDSLIVEWMAEYDIVRYPERLKDAVYAPEPTTNSISVGG
jgi:parvulin-like peptidyl-prolyl isomerase